MKKYLAKIDWNNTLKNKIAAECWNILNSEIDRIIDKVVHLKNRGNGQKRNTNEAIRKIKYKQTMWKTCRHTGSEEEYTIYKEGT